MPARQVLEFTLNGEQYCLDIEYVSEIVRRSADDVRSLPDAPPHVEGVMNLRGETTKIVDVGAVLSLESSDDRDRVIVFNGESGETLGWAVDDVTRVTTVDTADLEDADEPAIEGILNRDEGFLLWADPEEIAAAATVTA